ncbi:hypothetical protein SS50377_27406 [Spironucleus salmonicida]|uniref:RRM domain-containing protein n=1 Tax=Spironucleus salmonicida TaxID=348837 RepID=V6LG86_9EUKA|nr:hypothetical protein SS50377_27406 [Spironucleus salmonicida]|eukprot:EST43303.1 Hypothetical protein SS50377_16971 [Spironucleus salmonicida]
MATYYFVHIPKGIKFAEAREVIKSKCTCEVKNACKGAFFVRTESDSLQTFSIEDQECEVQISTSVNDENWDTLRMPKFMRAERTEDGEHQNEQRQPQKAERKPRNTERKPRDETREPRDENRQPREKDNLFRAFIVSSTSSLQEIESYFNKTLKIQNVGLDTFEGKNHGYLTFNTIEEVRAARAAFAENPLAEVTVRPYISRSMKNQRNM